MFTLFKFVVGPVFVTVSCKLECATFPANIMWSALNSKWVINNMIHMLYKLIIQMSSLLNTASSYSSKVT